MGSFDNTVQMITKILTSVLPLAGSACSTAGTALAGDLAISPGLIIEEALLTDGGISVARAAALSGLSNAAALASASGRFGANAAPLLNPGSPSPLAPMPPQILLADTKMSEIDLFYKNLITELLQKLSVQVKASEIAQWLQSPTDILLEKTRELEALHKELREKETTRDDFLVRGLGFFIHEVLGRNLNLLCQVPEMLIQNPERTIPWLLTILSPTSLKLVYCLKQAALKFREQATRQGLEIKFEGIDGVTLHSSVDLGLVSGVWENLFENGVKYFNRKQSSPHITVKWTPATGTLTYVDNGIGMEPEFATQLGAQAIREERAKDVQGTGTGWTIIFRNLKSLGWSWTLTTSPENGMQIAIVIPESHLV